MFAAIIRKGLKQKTVNWEDLTSDLLGFNSNLKENILPAFPQTSLNALYVISTPHSKQNEKTWIMGVADSTFTTVLTLTLSKKISLSPNQMYPQIKSWISRGLNMLETFGMM